jgi:hypothetical protein
MKKLIILLSFVYLNLFAQSNLDIKKIYHLDFNEGLEHIFQISFQKLSLSWEPLSESYQEELLGFFQRIKTSLKPESTDLVFKDVNFWTTLLNIKPDTQPQFYHRIEMLKGYIDLMILNLEDIFPINDTLKFNHMKEILILCRTLLQEESKNLVPYKDFLSLDALSLPFRFVVQLCKPYYFSAFQKHSTH